MNDKISDYIKYSRINLHGRTLDLRYAERVKLSSKVELFRPLRTLYNPLSEKLNK